MKRGQQKRIDTPKSSKWFHLFGAYNWRTDEVITMVAEKKNSDTFCRFIQHLFASVPDDRPVVLVLDNASYHHSAQSEALLAYFEDRSLTVWLPPYCSDLNPIERFWLHLKHNACANFPFKSLEQISSSVRKILAVQNDLQHPDRFLFLKTFC